MNKLFAILMSVLFAILAVPVTAQESTGVALAGAAKPSDLLIHSFTVCVKELKALEVTPDKAVKSCEKRFARESKRSEKVSGSAAKAANPFPSGIFGTVRRCYPSDAILGGC